jgi:hypothetical protein
MAYSREQFYKTANTPGLERAIYDLGQATGLGANFHERQMWKESSGRTGVLGDQGQSVGLGQIYDPTWKMLQGLDSSLTDRADPIQNVRAQGLLWKKNLKAAGGNARTALRMYNGSGPMAEQYADSLSPYLPNGAQYSRPVAPVGSLVAEGAEIQSNPMKQQELQAAYNRGIQPQQQQRRNEPMNPFGNIMTMQERYAPGIENVLAAYNNQRTR